MKRFVFYFMLLVVLSSLYACGNQEEKVIVNTTDKADNKDKVDKGNAVAKFGHPPGVMRGDTLFLKKILDAYIEQEIPKTQGISLLIEQGNEVLYSCNPDLRFNGASTLKVPASMLAEEKLKEESDAYRREVIQSAIQRALVYSDNDAWDVLLNYIDESDMLRYYKDADITVEEIQAHQTSARAMINLLSVLDEKRSEYPDVVENMEQAYFTYGASDYLKGMMKYGDYIDLGLVMLLDTEPPLRVATYMQNFFGYEGMERWVRVICQGLSEAGYVQPIQEIPPTGSIVDNAEDEDGL